MKGNELTIFNSINDNPVFASIMELLEEGYNPLAEYAGRLRFFNVMHKLMEFTVGRGFSGNLYHVFLTLLLIDDENFYTLAIEKKGEGAEDTKGYPNKLIQRDMSVIKELFAADLKGRAKDVGIYDIDEVFDYPKHSERKSPYYSTAIRDSIEDLAHNLGKEKSVNKMRKLLEDFYKNTGVGKLGLHKAFRINGEGEDMEIEPIRNITHVHMNDLVRYESAKKALVENTESFLRGEPANNCLLYGDAGTGKSTSIKALANEYYDKGLRIIEVYRHQYKEIHRCMSLIKNRNYRFIIYLDDLSFEEFETEYKYLKAVIEGGLEVKPENILIYATSNRKHLVRESFKDREEKEFDLHATDTVQEKLSLSSRFGTSIYYGAPDREEYYDIVRSLAKKAGIDMDEKELLAGADRFEIISGGRSGRCAKQYIDTILSGREV